MKKVLILIFTGFLVAILFIMGVNVKAEEQQTIIYYSGDILNGNDLYLFQDYSTTPNFENGYLKKKTITNQDIYNGDIAIYNGWYKDLGQDLIDEYTAPDNDPQNPYFWFYIPLNNMLVQHLQLALMVQEPYAAQYYVKYKDSENPVLFLTSGDSNEYLIMPPTNDYTREIEWFSYSVYYQDYLSSFKPLTSDTAYEFGYASGETNGFWSGYDSGYSLGHSRGYQEGYDYAHSIYTEENLDIVINFNQLIQNGNFRDTTVWQTRNDSFTVDSNKAAIIVSNNNNAFGLVQNLQVECLEGHIYACIFTTKSSGNNSRVRLRYPFETSFINITTTATDYFIRLNNETIQESEIFYIQYSNPIDFANIITLSNVMFMDLTAIYGEGLEPQTLEELRRYFPSKYYEFTTGENVSTNYLTGYNTGYNTGYYSGVDDGISEQATKQLTSTGWIQNIFGGISAFLNIQLLPGVTIGLLVGIPFIISLAYFIIRAFRGGGGA